MSKMIQLKMRPTPEWLTRSVPMPYYRTRDVGEGSLYMMYTEYKEMEGSNLTMMTEIIEQNGEWEIRRGSIEASIQVEEFEQQALARHDFFSALHRMKNFIKEAYP